MYTFEHIDRTGLTENVILERAKWVQSKMEILFPGQTGDLQFYIDCAIESAIEHNQ